MSVWAYVHGTGATAAAAASVAVTCPGTVTAGDLVCGVVTTYKAGGTLPTITITDNKGGNTWAISSPLLYQSPSSYLSLYYGVIANGGSSFQVTAASSLASSGYAISIDEFSATGYTISIDGSMVTNNASSGTALSVGTLTPSGTDLIYAVGGAYANVASWTAGSGGTLTYSNGGGSGVLGSGSEYYLNQTSGLAAAMSFGVSSAWGMIAAAFNATATGGGFTPWIYGDQVQDIFG